MGGGETRRAGGGPLDPRDGRERSAPYFAVRAKSTPAAKEMAFELWGDDDPAKGTEFNDPLRSRRPPSRLMSGRRTSWRADGQARDHLASDTRSLAFPALAAA